MEIEEKLFTELGNLIHETKSVIAELEQVDKEWESLGKLFLSFYIFFAECKESSTTVRKTLEMLSRKK